MSYSKLVSYVRISPNSTNPRYRSVKKIVIHHMAGNLSVETCGNVFAPTSRQASSNYGIGSDGRIACYVHEENRAWTTGNQIDHDSITIEVADDVIGGSWHSSDAAMKSLVNLCADICKRYGFRANYTGNGNGTLLMHKWYQATDCPGAFLESKFPWIATEVNKILDGVNEDPDGDIKSGGTFQAKVDEYGTISYQAHMRSIGWGNWQCDGDMVGSTGQNRRIEALHIKPESGKQMNVSVHIKTDGDKTYNNINKDTTIGTTNQKKRIESVKIDYPDKLRYRVHQKSYGWSSFVNNGQWAGVKGKSKQIEAFQLYKPLFLVRGHVQSTGWQGYVGSKETVGTTGQGKRLEAIQIDPLGNTIEAMAHIQGEGWVDYGKITKDTIIGTVGEAERLECLRLKGDFEYRAHIQSSGWTDWTKADGIATIGTTGQALRIEAIQFR